MKTRAAVLHAAHQPFDVIELDLDGPREGEVLIRYVAAGLCHSDLHLIDGDLVPRFPIVGGHEGAGIVEQVGPGVTRVKPGDHVGLAFNPPCGRCALCGRGRGNLCAMSRREAQDARAPSSFSMGGQQVQAMAGLGTFSPYTVVPEGSAVVMPDDVPFEPAALLGCAVTTGWGSSVYLAQVRPGDNVVVIGAGGIGVNAIQGAVNAGADIVVAVDTSEFKRQQALRFGASHAAAPLEEARDIVRSET